MTIGENIKKARKKKGITQKELGDKLGITQSSIAMFENDKTNIKFSTLEKIANALDTGVFDLFDLYNETMKIAMKYDIEQIKKTLITASTSKAMQNIDLKEQRRDMLDIYYDSLNEKGQIEAVKRIKELTYVPEYQNDPED